AAWWVEEDDHVGPGHHNAGWNPFGIRQVEMAWPFVVTVGLLAWGFALAVPSSRNIRFLTALSVVSILLLGSLVLPTAIRLPLQVVLIAAIGVALVRPLSFGLASISRGEAHADGLLLDAWRQYTSGPHGASALADIDLRPFEGLAPDWLAAARLFRWSAQSEVGSPIIDWHTKPDHLQRAARAYWHDAQFARVLGTSRLVTTWHEQVLLRCYYEMADEAMPTRAFTKSRAAPDVRKARALIREVNSMRMREAVSRETRDALARVLDGRVADPATGSGNEAFTEQRDAMRALRDAWV